MQESNYMKNPYAESLNGLKLDDPVLAFYNFCKEREKIRMILNEINPGLYESVPDPYYGGDNGFQKVYDMLDKACEKILAKIE